MLKYCAYLLLCLFFGFLDFYFNLRGFLSLLLYTTIASLIMVLKHNKNTKLNFKFTYNNYLLYGIASIISVSIFLGFLVQYFYPVPVDHSVKIDFYLITGTIILSFAEEVIFRGYWLNNFLEKYSITTSILITSTGFAFLHFFARNDPFFAFIGSVILSLIFLKQKSISNVFAIHLLYNFFATFLWPKIMLSYLNLDAIYKIIIFVTIAVINICFLKMLLKKTMMQN